MTNEMQTIQNESKKRFELEINGQTAFIDYTFKKSTNQIFLVHTEVPQALRGSGYGERLVKDTLDIIRSKELKIVPLCPFVVTYLKRHKDYLDIVDDSKINLFK